MDHLPYQIMASYHSKDAYYHVASSIGHWNWTSPFLFSSNVKESPITQPLALCLSDPPILYREKLVPENKDKE